MESSKHCHILITGAAKGIGYYLIEELLNEGHHVTVLDLDPTPLHAIEAQYPELLALECDVRDAERLTACVEESVRRFGPIDAAIHNACLCLFHSMDETTEHNYREVFDVNYFGALHLTRAVLPFMNQAGGRILFTGSGVSIMGFRNISAYASSKAAIEGLAKCLNLEYQNRHITFHILHPPLTKTESASPLPVPKQFMSDPQKVGRGLARNLFRKRFVICHNRATAFQMRMTYLFPLSMGRFINDKMEKLKNMK